MAVWGIFYLPPGDFDTFQSKLLRVTRSVAKFLRKLVNNILRAIKISLMNALHCYLVCSGVNILSEEVKQEPVAHITSPNDCIDAFLLYPSVNTRLR